MRRQGIVKAIHAGFRGAYTSRVEAQDVKILGRTVF